MDAFAGIDVAFRKRKLLPVALCVWEADSLVALPVTGRDIPLPPRGAGNVVSLDPAAITRFADETASYLQRLEAHFGVRIRRIGIDAPSEAKSSGLRRRKAEEALDALHVSCFTTPSVAEFAAIRKKAIEHIRAGGSQSSMPHANQLWMLVGFALFERLRCNWECLEVFPQATVSALGANGTHKSKPGGVSSQLAAASALTRWPNPPTEQHLKRAAHGPAHDQLDAYLAAWVAALPLERRTALGTPPRDAIWIPRQEVS